MASAALVVSFILALFLSFQRPRALILVVIALLPSQWMFVRVRDFYLTPLDPLVAAALVGYSWRLWSGSEDARWSLRAHALVAAFVLSYAASFVITGGIPRTWFRMVLACALAPVAAEALRSEEDLDVAVRCVAVAATVDVCYGLLGLPSYAPPEPGRFSGTSNPNFAALLLLAGAAALLAQWRRSRARLLWVLALVGCGVATLSRAGVLAVLVSLAFVVWPGSERAGRWVTAGVASFALMASVVAFPSSRAIVPGTAEAVVGSLKDESVGSGTDSTVSRSSTSDAHLPTSVEVRTHVLTMAWRGLRENPLTGVGIGRFRAFTNEDPFLRRYTGGTGTVTHNSLVEPLVEGGIGPGVLLLSFLIVVLGSSLRLHLKMPRGSSSALGACLAAATVWVVGAQFANVLLLYSFWVSMGLVVRARSTASPRPAPLAVG